MKGFILILLCVLFLIFSKVFKVKEVVEFVLSVILLSIDFIDILIFNDDLDKVEELIKNL